MSLINKADIASLIPLAVNLAAERINLFADEIEKVKCTEFLGRDLYKDVLDNPGDYTELITYIKPVLCYWTYIKYLREGKNFNTATGVVIKRTDSSIPLSDYELKVAIESNCLTSRFYESELQLHLEEGEYELYEKRVHTGCKRFKISKPTNEKEI